MGKPQLSIAKRAQIVTIYKDGKSMGQIASELGVSKRTVFDWGKLADFNNLEASLIRKKGSDAPRKTLWRLTGL